MTEPRGAKPPGRDRHPRVWRSAPAPWAIAAARRRVAWVAALGALGALAVAWAYSSLQPLIPPCPFHALTGLYCPGCGSLRATHALLHGRLAEALQFNALAVGLAFALPGAAVLERLRTPAGPAAGARVRAATGWLLLGAVLGFLLLRNLPLEAFRSLAPRS